MLQRIFVKAILVTHPLHTHICVCLCATKAVVIRSIHTYDCFLQIPFDVVGFNEFYNQRRRWMPSTMANILDLLRSWRTTVRVNENVSMLYIIYQAVLFVAGIMGTGTIFLMIVGALVVSAGVYLVVSQRGDGHFRWEGQNMDP